MADPLAYDFYSPFVSAAIVEHNGERIPLWTNATELATPGSVKDHLYLERIYSMPYVSEVSVTLNLSELPVIQVTLTPPFREAMTLLDSALVEWGRSEVQVQFGYTGGAPGGSVLSPVFTGLMLQPEISMGDDVTITLKAQGAFSLATDERNFTVSNLPRLGIIDIALKGAGAVGGRKLTLDASEALADPISSKLLNETLESFSSGHKTDWDLIYSEASYCRCWPQLVGDTLKLIPRGKRLSQPASKIFSFFDFPKGQVGPLSGVFPVLSLSTPASAIYLPGVSKAMANGGIDSATRTPQHDFYSDSTVRPTLVGAGGAYPKADAKTPGVTNTTNPNESKDGAAFMFGDINDPDTKAKMEADYEKLISHLGVQLQITTVGIPDLLPGEVVAVRGAGVRLNSNYGVFEVTHTVGSGGFQTQFTAWSNTSKLDDQNAAVPATDPHTKVSSSPAGDFTANPSNGGLA